MVALGQPPGDFQEAEDDFDRHANRKGVKHVQKQGKEVHHAKKRDRIKQDRVWYVSDERRAQRAEVDLVLLGVVKHFVVDGIIDAMRNSVADYTGYHDPGTAAIKRAQLYICGGLRIGQPVDE